MPTTVPGDEFSSTDLVVIHLSLTPRALTSSSAEKIGASFTSITFTVTSCESAKPKMSCACTKNVYVVCRSKSTPARGSTIVGAHATESCAVSGWMLKHLCTAADSDTKAYDSVSPS